MTFWSNEIKCVRVSDARGLHICAHQLQHVFVFGHDGELQHALAARHKQGGRRGGGGGREREIRGGDGLDS